MMELKKGILQLFAFVWTVLIFYKESKTNNSVKISFLKLIYYQS